MSVTIRKIEARDEARWRVLWDGYCRFYERAPNEPVTCHLWARIMDSASPVHAIVAEDATGAHTTEAHERSIAFLRSWVQVASSTQITAAWK